MRSKYLLTLGMTTLFMIVGCSLPPRPVPGEMIASATGLSSPIAFREEGEAAESETASPEVLSFTEAIRLGLSHSPGLQAALARVRMSEAEADQAWLLPNPVLSISLRRPTSGGRPMVDAMLGEDLLGLIQRPGLIRQADQQLRAEAARAVEAALDALAEVQEAYVAAQALDALVAELVAQRGIVEQILELAQQRLTVGVGGYLDVSSAEQRHVELETEISQRVLEQKQARLTLARLIGDPSGEATWELLPWRPELPTGANDSTWVEAALNLRPEVQAKRWELAALGTEEGLRWSAAIEGTEVGVEGEREGGEWAVGPSLSVPLPIFDLGQARRRRARAAVSLASHELTQARRMVIEEVRSAHAAYLATRPIAEKVRRELVPLAELKLRQSESQFGSGDMGLIEVLLAEQELRMARTRLIELDQKSAASLIRLERAVGGPHAAAELSPSGPSPPPGEETPPQQEPTP